MIATQSLQEAYWIALYRTVEFVQYHGKAFHGQHPSLQVSNSQIVVGADIFIHVSDRLYSMIGGQTKYVLYLSKIINCPPK